MKGWVKNNPKPEEPDNIVFTPPSAMDCLEKIVYLSGIGKILTMKSLYILTFLLIGIFSLQAQNNFRNTTWGMSPEEVRASEGKDPVAYSDKDALYEVEVAGLKAAAFYMFFGGEMLVSGYLFGEEYVNLNNYIKDYEYIKKILTHKYGDPKSDDEIWNHDLYFDDTQNYGFAVSINHLAYQAIWELDDVFITQTLDGENYEVVHRIVYMHRDLHNKPLDEGEKSMLDDF